MLTAIGIILLLIILAIVVARSTRNERTFPSRSTTATMAHLPDGPNRCFVTKGLPRVFSVGCSSIWPK
jgi:hypothetical protein